MGSTSDKRRFLATLRGEIPDRVPIHENVINKRYIEHVTGLDTYEQTLAMPPEHLVPMLERIGMDMATVGYGFREQGLNTWDRVQSCAFPSFDPFLARVDSFLEYMRGRSIGLVVYVHGPLDSTYLSMGYMEFFLAVMDDPRLVQALMDRFTEHHLQLIKALLQRPVDAIELVDDVGMKTGGFIRPELMRDWWAPRLRRMAEPIVNARIPTVFHSDGPVEVFMDTLLDLGIAATNPIDPMSNDIRDVKRRYGDRITLMGNLDVGGVLAFGTPDDVRRETRALLHDLMPGGRYIAMSGNSISDAVAPENYDAMLETVQEYGWYGAT